jgi:short-subunit dehydrogenase
MKRLILITGAAKGIGSAIAIELNKVTKYKSNFILFDINEAKLNETKEKMLHHSKDLNQVTCVKLDFGELMQVEDYLAILKKNLPNKEDLKNYDELIVIYNHGTLVMGSDVTKTAQDILRKKFEINFFSVWCLLGAINIMIPKDLITRQFHINMSSGYAIKPTVNG